MGVPEEKVREYLATKESDDFEVFEENAEAVAIFVDLSTQWNLSPGGRLVGLNYSSLDFMFRLYRVKDRKTRFEEIRLLESGALKALREAKT